jgi:hypothetical protein
LRFLVFSVDLLFGHLWLHPREEMVFASGGVRDVTSARQLLSGREREGTGYAGRISAAGSPSGVRLCYMSGMRDWYEALCLVEF